MTEKINDNREHFLKVMAENHPTLMTMLEVMKKDRIALRGVGRNQTATYNKQLEGLILAAYMEKALEAAN